MPGDSLAPLSTRRSLAPPFLEAPGPDEAELRAILTVASRVPDHGKLVPWRFLVMAGEARGRLGALLADALRADDPEATPDRLAAEAGRFTQAPLVVAVVSRAAPHAKIPEWEQTLTAGAVCMNLLHAAHALGFAGSWLTGAAAYDRRVLDPLGLAPRERLAGFIHLGRPSATPPDRPRPDLDALIARPFA